MIIRVVGGAIGPPWYHAGTNDLGPSLEAPNFVILVVLRRSIHALLERPRPWDMLECLHRTNLQRVLDPSTILERRDISLEFSPCPLALRRLVRLTKCEYAVQPFQNRPRESGYPNRKCLKELSDSHSECVQAPELTCSPRNLRQTFDRHDQCPTRTACSSLHSHRRFLRGSDSGHGRRTSSPSLTQKCGQDGQSHCLRSPAPGKDGSRKTPPQTQSPAVLVSTHRRRGSL